MERLNRADTLSESIWEADEAFLIAHGKAGDCSRTEKLILVVDLWTCGGRTRRHKDYACP